MIGKEELARGPPSADQPPKSGGMRGLAEGIKNFLAREDGPTPVEYAVMLALIVVVCITAITALGTNADKSFDALKKAGEEPK